MRNQTTTNPPVDDDLQQAIDNITSTTNTDPVFSDPVAGPNSIPNGAPSNLDNMDFPTAPAPEPAPAPESPAGNVAPMSVEPTAPAPEPMAPLSAMEGISELMPSADIPEPTRPMAPARGESLSMNQLKQSALRDLAPLLDHLNMTAPQKFSLYRNIFENLRDYTVLTRAYGAAKEINDPTERAEALLYLIESIDKM